MTDWLAIGALVPVRLFTTSIRYRDPMGQELQIENSFLHHHNETLVGPGDPWLYGRVATSLGGFTLGARLGATLPLGRTVPDPFVLGDQGISHEHSQFGTGTIGGIAGVEASRFIGGVHLDASLLTIQTVYANGHGYEAGDRYAAALGAATAFGAAHWRFRAMVETVHETAETWGGVVHTDDGNIGRTDVLAGVEATWLATDDWHVGVSLQVPLYTHIQGGQVSALGFLGVTVGTHFHLWGGDDDKPRVAPGDWRGLDERDVGGGGSVVPLTPVPGKITVYDFWATWCQPCKLVDHELAAIARRHPDAIAVRKIDVVEVDSPVAVKYLGDATLPHLVVFGRDGALLWEHSAPPLQLTAEVEQLVSAPRAAVDPSAPRIAIAVTEAGFAPADIAVPRDRAVTLVVTRTTDATCATDVHFVLPDGSRIDEVLPLGRAIAIALPPQPPGDIAFACGMNMVRGTLHVR